MTDLWAAVVAADRELARAQAEFYRHSPARREELAEALRGSISDRATALSFLQEFGDDVPDLLDHLNEEEQFRALLSRIEQIDGEDYEGIVRDFSPEDGAECPG